LHFIYYIGEVIERDNRRGGDPIRQFKLVLDNTLDEAAYAISLRQSG
jgi:hypothetical protein